MVQAAVLVDPRSPHLLLLLPWCCIQDSCSTSCGHIVSLTHLGRTTHKGCSSCCSGSLPGCCGRAYVVFNFCTARRAVQAFVCVLAVFVVQNTPNLESCQPLKTQVVGVSCMELFLWVCPRLSLGTSGVFFPQFVCVSAWKALLHVSDAQIVTNVFVQLFAAKPNCFVRITDYKNDLEMLENILISSCREGKRLPSSGDRPWPAAGTRGSPCHETAGQGGWCLPKETSGAHILSPELFPRPLCPSALRLSEITAFPFRTHAS